MPGINPVSYIDKDYKDMFLTDTYLLIIPDKLPVRLTLFGVKLRVEVGEFAVIPKGYLLQVNSAPERRVVSFDGDCLTKTGSFRFLSPILNCPFIYHPVTTEDGYFSGYTTHLIPEQIIAAGSKETGDEAFKCGQLNGAVVASNMGTLTLNKQATINYKATSRLEGLRLSPLTLANDLYSYGASEDPFREAKFQATLFSLYSILGEEILQLANHLAGDGGYKASSYEKLDQAIAYCNLHYKEQFSLGDIASHCGLARNYLSSLFKDFYKIAFYDYLLRLRVGEAARLLIKSDLAISKIASEAGFNSDTTFGRVFKNYTGLSPREFRKLCN